MARIHSPVELLLWSHEGQVHPAGKAQVVWPNYRFMICHPTQLRGIIRTILRTDIHVHLGRQHRLSPGVVFAEGGNWGELRLSDGRPNRLGTPPPGGFHP